MSVKYAILPSRVKALVIDQIIIIAAMYGASELFGMFESVSNTLRITAFVVIFLVYEPLFVSLFGGTIGHQYSKIAVKTEKDLSKNLLFPLAVLRLVIKVSLGWISLLTVTSNDKRKALHDIAVKSVVIESING